MNSLDLNVIPSPDVFRGAVSPQGHETLWNISALNVFFSLLYRLLPSDRINPSRAEIVPQPDEIKKERRCRLQATTRSENDRPAAPRRRSTSRYKPSPSRVMDRTHNWFWLVWTWPLALLACIRNSVTGWWKEGTFYHIVAECWGRCDKGRQTETFSEDAADFSNDIESQWNSTGEHVACKNDGKIVWSESFWPFHWQN